jgi:protein transport protein SEC13
VSETSYEHCATLQGHEGPVWQVSWAHPKFGVILASCSFDGSVLIHIQDPTAAPSRTWTLLHAARNLHESSVNACAFAPPEFGLQLAAASSDGKVSILSHLPNNTWSVDYLQDCSMGVNAVSWAPVGAYFDANKAAAAASAALAEGEPAAAVAFGESPRLVTAGCDNQIRFWVCHNNASDGQQQQQPPPGEWTLDASQCQDGGLQHTDWVRDVAWAPVTIPNHNTVASCSEDGTVLIWTQKIDPSAASNATTTEESVASSHQSHPWKATLLHRFDEPVWRVSWSVTGHLLAVSSGDSTVTLWKKATVQNESKWVQVDMQMQPLGGEAATAVSPAAAPPPPPPH